MVVCDVCGSKMYPNIRRHTNKNNPNRKPKSYASFRCNCRKSKTNIVCNNSEIKIEYLDEFVLGEVTEICSNDKIRAELTEEVNKAFIEEVNEKKKSIKLKESELKSLDKKISNILVALENGINSEDIVYRLEEIKANKKTLQDELEYIKTLIKELDTSGNDVEPRSQSFMQPSLDLEGGKIVFKESGQYKTAIYFSHLNILQAIYT